MAPNARLVNETPQQKEDRERSLWDHEPLDQAFFDQFSSVRIGGSRYQEEA
jgi:hypothetical protein